LPEIGGISPSTAPTRRSGTKSRRYSTTFTVLRRARVAFAKRRRTKDSVPLDAWDRPEDDDQAVIVVASWVHVGTGYTTEGEGWLALSAARGLANSGGWPGRSYAPPQHEREKQGCRDKLLTVEEAADRLGTSVRFIRRLVAERRIAYVKVGRHVRISEADLAGFVAAGRREASA
jgi:excisionase family DNA binding protein